MSRSIYNFKYFKYLRKLPEEEQNTHVYAWAIFFAGLYFVIFLFVFIRDMREGNIISYREGEVVNVASEGEKGNYELVKTNIANFINGLKNDLKTIDINMHESRVLYQASSSLDR